MKSKLKQVNPQDAVKNKILEKCLLPLKRISWVLELNLNRANKENTPPARTINCIIFNGLRPGSLNLNAGDCHK